MEELEMTEQRKLSNQRFYENLSRREILLGITGMIVAGCSPLSTAPTKALADMAASPSPTATTYIHEFPHPIISVHYHPNPGFAPQFTISEVDDALQWNVNALELDLHYYPAGETIVCNHEGSNSVSPTLEAVIQRILAKKGTSPTVNNDGLQFNLVLEPKAASTDAEKNLGDQYYTLLFDGLAQILTKYKDEWSTAVAANGDPRGITVVITGAYTQQFYNHLTNNGADQSRLNQLCIVEAGLNSPIKQDIINLSPQQVPFKWNAVEHFNEKGQVNALHEGGVNLRVWKDERILAIASDNMSHAMAAGADEINADHDQVQTLQQMIHSQQPRTSSPALTIQGTQALLTWQGVGSNNLYVAVGSLGASGLSFQRQILLTALLAEQPLAKAPSAAFLPNGNLFIGYEGTANQRLWYVSGKFRDPVRFVIFDGQQHELTLPNDAGRRGTTPSLAVGPDGRVLFVYEGTADQKLWYVSGFVNEQGVLVGTEYSLTEGTQRRGYTPTAAIGKDGHVVVAYQGTSGNKLWYVSGNFDASGRIVGTEYSLTEGDQRLGFTPSVAIDESGHVIVAYQGTSGNKLWYVSGSFDASGRIVGTEYSLTEGDQRLGSRPTVAFASTGQVVILYQGTSEGKMWYVYGQLDSSGQLIGTEQLIDMGI
jgi:hypothetical protein